MATRVLYFLRLSTQKQARRQGNGEPDIPAQREEIDKFIATKPGWVKVGEIAEKGTAFKKSASDRDEIEEALEKAERREFDVLMLWKGDRLTRNMVDTLVVFQRLVNLGIQVWSVVDASGGKQWAATSANELLMLAFEGYKNQSESENISIRVKTRMRQLAEQGEWQGSKVPFGYELKARKDQDNEPIFQGGRPVRDLVPHPDNAPIVRELFRRYLEGEGYYKLAGWLNGKETRTYTGQWWSQKTVADVLSNPIYAGLIVYARTEGILGTQKRKRTDVPIMVKGKHVQLIDEQTWQQAQHIREARAKHHVRERMAEVAERPEYVLAGILRCAVCGGTMGGHMRRYKRQNGEPVAYPVYRCLTHKASGRCPVTTYVASAVEGAFIEAVERLALPGSLREFIEARDTERLARAREAQDGRKRAQKRLKELEQEHDRVRKDYRAGKLSVEDYNGFRSEIDAERASLEVELGKPLPQVEIKDFAALAAAAKEIRANWDYLTSSEKRAFAFNIVEAYELRVEVSSDAKVELHHVPAVN